MITTSAPARAQASSARACAIEKAPSGSRKRTPPGPSRVPSRSVYTALSGIGPLATVAAMAWKLSDRTLELERPLGAGIVNVTTDSMFEGARSGTPGQAVADGLALAEAGFGMLDVGAVAAKAGPPVL